MKNHHEQWWFYWAGLFLQNNQSIQWGTQYGIAFDFVIKTPPAAVQLLEAAKLKKGSGEPNRKKVAKVSWDQIKTIAEDKMVDLNAFTIESAMRMIAGTARSMGITVTGNAPN